MQTEQCTTEFINVVDNTTPIFERLSAIDISHLVEKKGNLNYLSWANAWKILKSACPSARFTVREFSNGQQYFFQDGIGYIVHTSVSIENETMSMWLPIMDHRNNAKLSGIDSRDVSDTIMRCLVKNIALFGLGIGLYAGEDLPGAKDKDKEKPQIKSEICTAEELTELSTLIDLEPEVFYTYKTDLFRGKLLKAIDNKLLTRKTWEEVINDLEINASLRR